LLNFDGLVTLVDSWASEIGSTKSHVFIGVAEAERETLVAEAYTLAGLLRSAAPHAQIDTCTLLDENHLSVWPQLYVRGLTSLLG